MKTMLPSVVAIALLPPRSHQWRSVASVAASRSGTLQCAEEAQIAEAASPVVARPSITGAEYSRGLATVSFVTLLFASNSPVLRSAFTSVEHVPPPLLVNAVASGTALSGLIVGAPLLRGVPAPASIEASATSELNRESLRAGAELGLVKCVGTSFNLYGLSLTSADHGAFLIQLTTLLVPVAQAFQGVPIPPRIWAAVGTALVGLAIFTADPSDAAASLTGDASCVAAALCYALYDLRLFVWGKRVTPLRLIQNKVAAQAALAVTAVPLLAYADARQFVESVTPSDLVALAPLVLWSGIVVNGVAPFLQVGGQQAVGPARAQVVYASGPLWAALLSLAVLGETIGPQGLLGGAAFLAAVLLAAGTPAPDPACEEEVCEV